MKSRADLLGVSRGYWPARALLTAIELRVFETLGGRRLSAPVLARRMGADPRSTAMLLDALVGLGVLAKTARAYAIAAPMRPLLQDGEDSALSMLRHHARLWRAWDRLTDCVRDGRAAELEGGFRGDASAAEAFTLAMRDGARRLAPLVADEVSFAGCSRVLDLGGGPAVYAAAFVRRTPGLEVVVVDLPHVCRAGAAVLAAEPDVAGRITYHPADLDRDPLPRGADGAFLSHVIHSQTSAEVQALFRKVRRALAPGGLFVVRDFFTTPDRTRPPGASLFALNMLVNTAGGRAYSARETQAWLRQAGFASARYRRSSALPDTGYVLARVASRRRRDTRRVSSA